jgi:hypothetical protein
VTIDISGNREPVEVAIFDVRGKQLALFNHVAIGSLVWNAVGIPDGVYFVRSSAGHRTYRTVKLLLRR